LEAGRRGVVLTRQENPGIIPRWDVGDHTRLFVVKDRRRPHYYELHARGEGDDHGDKLLASSWSMQGIRWKATIEYLRRRLEGAGASSFEGFLNDASKEASEWGPIAALADWLQDCGQVRQGRLVLSYLPRVVLRTAGRNAPL
jgi:hypothetical protein